MNSPINTPTSSSRSTKIQSFLEALRNSQGSAREDSGEQFRHHPFAEFQQKKEIEKRRSEQFLQARQQEWNQVFSAKEKQTQLRIEQIRQQLQLLVKQVKRLDRNLIKATSAPVTEVGEYHENFLLRIQKAIQLFSLEAQDANSWLALYHSRSTKKGFYLSMAQSQETSFTQANERSVATSIG